ncbi:LysR family transcriptional regulator [Pseudonocardia sp. NPDC049635]|uniref:LysR family transcriptional regulator n=1 Tax=Pseudonocardia sp. NPDC049635 TaxID=3155506 RepID=UPI0033CC8529
MAADILIRQLEYVVALAREEHFGRAAVACHVSQPALSAGVRKLERELGVTIVRRGRRFAGFTEEGRRVVAWAHRILAERDGLRSDLGRMHDQLTSTLRIGAIPTAVPPSPLVTIPFRHRHPQSRVRIEALPSTEILRRLDGFEIDVGLTYIDQHTPESTSAIPLYREHYLLLTPSGGELAAREVVRWTDLGALPLCMLDTSMQNRRILDHSAAAAGARLAPVVETNTVDSLYAHAASGGYSSIIAHTWLHAFGIPAGMTTVPLAGPGPRPTVGIVTGRRPHSIAAQALLEVVGGLDVAAELDRSATAATAATG